MSKIETLYLFITVVCLLAFVAGFFSGVGATLSILRRWRRQWRTDHAQSAVVAPEFQNQETPTSFNTFGQMGPTATPPPLTVLHSGDSFERGGA